MGALTGSLIAGALAVDSEVWTPLGLRSLDHAQAIVRGDAAPIDLPADAAFPAAIGLAAAPTPLLTEPATVAIVDHVRAWLADPDAAHAPRAEGDLVSEAVERARAGSFTEVVEAAHGDELMGVLVGGIAGLEGGIGAVPARLVAGLRAPDGRRGRRFLARLSARLLGVDRTDWYDPRGRRGPREVLPGLWLSNLYGTAAFATEHPDGLVLSLCDDEGRLDQHGDHLVFHLEDTPKAEANPQLPLVLDDVLGEVAAARAAGRPVLVHCRHGASRTGLVLRLILVDELGLDAEAALMEAQCLWPATSSWNRAWNREVERRAEG